MKENLSLAKLLKASVSALAVASFMCGPLFAAEKSTTSAVQTTSAEQSAAKDGERKTLEDATVAIRETREALKFLESGKQEESLAALERAIGKLELILARSPDLALAPTSSATVRYEALGDLGQIKKMRREIEAAIEDGRLQRARMLLRAFGNENVTNVASIPLASYPAAMKQAARLIDQSKLEEAKTALTAALSTLVITETVDPVPLADARSALKEAEQLTETSNRTEDQNKRLKTLLENARSDLELAEAFGYGKKDDFDDMYAQVADIEAKTKGGKAGSGLFARVKSSIANLTKSSQPDEAKESESKINGG